MMDREMAVGLIMIVLASVAGYYWYLARLYNLRESSYKDQLEEALAEIEEAYDKGYRDALNAQEVMKDE